MFESCGHMGGRPLCAQVPNEEPMKRLLLTRLQACHPVWARLVGGLCGDQQAERALSGAAPVLCCTGPSSCLVLVLGASSFVCLGIFEDRFSVAQPYLELRESSSLSLGSDFSHEPSTSAGAGVS